MKKLFLIILITSLALTSASASNHNMYLSFSIGLAYLEEFNIPKIPERYIIRVEPKKGPLVVTVCGGYKMLENLRLEGEIGYRSNKIDNAEATIIDPLIGSRFVGVDGKITSLSIMVNIWYEFHTKKRLMPYLGGGFGFARVFLEDLNIITEPVVPNPPMIKTPLVDDTDWQFSMQVGAGIGYELGKKFVIDLNYRYFVMLDPEFTNVMGDQFKGKNRGHNFQLAVRHLF